MNYSHVAISGDFNHPELDWIEGRATKGPDHKSSVFLEEILSCFNM